MFEKLPKYDKLIKTSRIYEVEIDRIVEIGSILRSYEPVSVVKLAASIQKIGLIEPIILRLPCRAFPTSAESEFAERVENPALPCPDTAFVKLKERVSGKIDELRKYTEMAKNQTSPSRFALISGGYRLRAYKMLGFKTIPARFALFEEQNEAAIRMVGEFFGSCSDIFERSRKFVRTCIDLDMNAADLAQKLGFQSKYASALFSIAAMSDSEADLASLYKLPFEAIAQISRVSSPIARLALIEQIKDGSTSSAQLAELIADVNSGKRKSYTQSRKFFCKDIRIYVNTMKKTVAAMVENGIKADFDIVESADNCVMTIRINRSEPVENTNVSRETLSLSVKKEGILGENTPESVENSVETIENYGVSRENQSKSVIIDDNQAKSSKTVENVVESVENREYHRDQSDESTQKLAANDTARQVATASDVCGVLDKCFT